MRTILAGVLTAAMLSGAAFADTKSADAPFRTAEPVALTADDLARFDLDASVSAMLEQAIADGRTVVLLTPDQMEAMKAGQQGSTVMWTIVAVLAGVALALALT